MAKQVDACLVPLRHAEITSHPALASGYGFYLNRCIFDFESWCLVFWLCIIFNWPNLESKTFALLFCIHLLFVFFFSPYTSPSLLAVNQWACLALSMHVSDASHPLPRQSPVAGLKSRVSSLEYPDVHGACIAKVWHLLSNYISVYHLAVSRFRCRLVFTLFSVFSANCVSCIFLHLFSCLLQPPLPRHSLHSLCSYQLGLLIRGPETMPPGCALPLTAMDIVNLTRDRQAGSGTGDPSVYQARLCMGISLSMLRRGFESSISTLQRGQI